MNAQQKKFILKQLIPFILRDQGRGFAMERWLITDVWTEATNGLFTVDGVKRPVPVCNTVACIGGSICSLKNLKASGVYEAGCAIGLSPDHAVCLFYGASLYLQSLSVSRPRSWPIQYVRRFAQAKTALGKAKVAVALLKEVVKTNGEILDTGKPYGE